MSSQTNHSPSTWCRNRFTRSSWALPLMLLIASPVTRTLAVTGTLVFGTGCNGPTFDDCEQEYEECIALCDENDDECRDDCGQDYDECVDAVYEAAENREAAADAAAEAGMACVAMLACTLEAVGDGDGDGDDGWDEPAPSDDDWGDDWGELEPDDDRELAPLPDLGG